MKKITINPRTHKNILAEELKNPRLKKAYDNLAFEFSVIDAMIIARSKRGMTQAKLAKKLGTKQSAIARLESGRGNPTLSFVQRLADVLDLDLKVTPRYVKR